MDLAQCIWQRGHAIFGRRNLVLVDGISRLPVEALGDIAASFLHIPNPFDPNPNAWAAPLRENGDASRQVRLTDHSGGAVVLINDHIPLMSVGERPVFGPRLLSHMGWESKIRSMGPIHRLGVPHPRWEAAPNNFDALMTAYARQSANGSRPTIWSFDNFGVTTDGEGTRLVLGVEDAIHLAKNLHPMNQLVRIAIFERGPYWTRSMLVADEGVFPLPPVRSMPAVWWLDQTSPMSVGSFGLKGLGSLGTVRNFKVPLPVFKRMDKSARFIAEAARSEGYRGFMTIDGAGEHFRVHDIATRIGASVHRMAEESGVPLTLLHYLVAAREAQGLPLAQLHDEVSEKMGGRQTFNMRFTPPNSPLGSIDRAIKDEHGRAFARLRYDGGCAAIKGEIPPGNQDDEKLIATVFATLAEEGIRVPMTPLSDFGDELPWDPNGTFGSCDSTLASA